MEFDNRQWLSCSEIYGKFQHLDIITEYQGTRCKVPGQSIKNTRVQSTVHGIMIPGWRIPEDTVPGYRVQGTMVQGARMQGVGYHVH